MSGKESQQVISEILVRFHPTTEVVGFPAHRIKMVIQNVKKRSCPWCNRNFVVHKFSSSRCMFCGILYSKDFVSSAIRMKKLPYWQDIPKGCLLVLDKYTVAL